MNYTSHSECCSCGHHHDHNESHLNILKKWILLLVIVTVILFFLKPFIISQMLARSSSYYGYFLYDETARMCRKVVFIDKDNIRALKMLGYAYRGAGDMQKSADAFEKVFKLNPKDKGAIFDLATAYYSCKRYSEAYKYFEMIIKAGPDKTGSLNINVLNYYNSSLTMLEKCRIKSGQNLFSEKKSDEKH
ncbi:MAG: tetratricopeptide repeat protein [Endomicrobiaceae bacterium]